MGNSENQVKVVGIAKELPKDLKYFTEISIPEIIKIPVEKPDIEQLVEVIVEPEVISMRIVDTICSKSFEGQMLSGKKLILELKLKQKIVYVADEASQPVHAAHYEEVMKSTFVIVPKSVDDNSIELLLKVGRVKAIPYIEDIYAEQKDNRTVFKNITLLIDVIINC